MLDLHGALDRVICLGCRAVMDRHRMQEQLLALNPRFAGRLDELAVESRTAPDGDAEVDRTADFRYPACPTCGGMLKPDVVFFGENADRAVVTFLSDPPLEDADILGWAVLESIQEPAAIGGELRVIDSIPFDVEGLLDHEAGRGVPNTGRSIH